MKTYYAIEFNPDGYLHKHSDIRRVHASKMRDAAWHLACTYNGARQDSFIKVDFGCGYYELEDMVIAVGRTPQEAAYALYRYHYNAEQNQT